MIPIFYIWIEIITVLSVIQFWLLAGEVFNPRQAKRIFPLVIAGGSFAGLGAGYSIKPFVEMYGSENLLYMTMKNYMFLVILADCSTPMSLHVLETEID